MLEASLWPHNAFLTLTFRNSSLPSCGVSVAEHQSFIKNLRNQWHLATGGYFRFYGCGEYGEKTFRPHYHYALFNFPTCRDPQPFSDNHHFRPCSCDICRFVTRVWGKGHIFLGTLEPESAGYVAGYVTKKMTKKDDDRLRRVDPDTGEVTYLNPEFSKQSTRPGIAAGAVDKIITRWEQSGLEDLPTGLRHGNRFMPLGRYLKGKINEKFEVEPLSQNALEARQMLSLLPHVKEDPSYAAALSEAPTWLALKHVHAQRVLQIEQKFDRRSKKNEI